MYFSNALVPTANEVKINDADDKDAGGFEMGTWDFGTYTDMIGKALGKNWLPETEVARISENNRFSYAIRYVFTKEDMAKIHAWLLANSSPVEIKGKQCIEIQSKTIFEKKNIHLYPEWFNRLIDLFSSEFDTVSFVSA